MAETQPTHAHASPQPTFDPSRYLTEPSVETVLVRVTHEGEPTAKQRPRLALKTGRVYTPGSTKDHQKALALLAKPMLGNSVPDSEWAFGIRAVFYVQTHQRKDVDNMLKTVLDAMNRLIFADDSQVKELMGWSVLDHIRPRTEFVVYRLFPIDREQGECIVCGVKFRRYRSWRARLFCSRQCNAVYHSKGVRGPCVTCGAEVVRIPSHITGRVYCTTTCFQVSQRNRREEACGTCGKKFSRPASFFKEHQSNFFCSQGCYRKASRSGKTTTQERMSEASHKGWATRRAKTNS